MYIKAFSFLELLKQAHVTTVAQCLHTKEQLLSFEAADVTQ